MRIELVLSEDEHLTCGSCGELKGDEDKVYIGDYEEQAFSVLCSRCLDLEEAALANAETFTGFDPEIQEAFK